MEVMLFAACRRSDRLLFCVNAAGAETLPSIWSNFNGEVENRVDFCSCPRQICRRKISLLFSFYIDMFANQLIFVGK